MSDTESVEVYGPFLRITQHTWVRHDAILLIRTSPSPQGEVSQVTVRPNNGAPGQVVLTEYSARQIIDAITVASSGQ